MKKWIIITISLLVVIAAGIASYFLFFNKKEETLPIVKEIKPINELSIVLKENLDTPFLSKVKVSDFIESSNYEVVDDYDIETNSIGEKEIEFNLKENESGYTIDYKFTINIKDVNPPTVWLSSSKSINQYFDGDLAKSIMCIDDYDSNPVCTIEGYYNTNVVGTYPLVYKATDSSGNTETINFNLYVTNSSSTPYTGEPVRFADAYNMYKNENTMLGLDISSWQEDIDFEAVKNAGVEFVMIRVGSEDRNGRFIDKWFERYYEGAKKAGLKVGAYYYSYAENEEYALEDAKYVINALNGRSLDLPVAFDFEEWGRVNGFHLSKYRLTMMAKIFLDEMKKNGYEGMNYSSKAFLEEVWLDTTYPTWLAHYIDKTSYTGEYKMWQFSSMVSISGVSGRVDCNVLYLDR